MLLMAVLTAGAVVLLLGAAAQPAAAAAAKRCCSSHCVRSNIIGFFVYKGFLSQDVQFLEVSGLDRFNWFSELPMQLCNINMFLIPIGILTTSALACSASPFSSRRSLRSWLSCSRRRRLSGYSLWLPRMLGVLPHAHAHPRFAVSA
ncbi:MAG: hypothetical protein ACLUNO_06495 [Oscillospiraceae bacterium]